MKRILIKCTPLRLKDTAISVAIFPQGFESVRSSNYRFRQWANFRVDFGWVSAPRIRLSTRKESVQIFNICSAVMNCLNANEKFLKHKQVRQIMTHLCRSYRNGRL